MAASAGLMPGSSASSDGTGFETCLSATVTGDSPVYGSLPLNI